MGALDYAIASSLAEQPAKGEACPHGTPYRYACEICDTSQPSDPADAAVGDLLAVIHGDGGHYQDQHGLVKAARDAEQLVQDMRQQLAATPPTAQRHDVPGKSLPTDEDGLPIYPAHGAGAAVEVVTNLEFFTVPDGLHVNTTNLISRFASALAEKLSAAEQKYGYSDGWSSPDWMDECRAHLLQHVQKGDPRDVAAYCAFLWHHGADTTPPQQRSEQVAGGDPRGVQAERREDMSVPRAGQRRSGGTIDYLRRIHAEVKRDRAIAAEKKALFDCAMTFNTLHTFQRLRLWMCPQCNRTHAPESVSFLTGLQYPACCSIGAGHRLYSHHATKEGTP